MSARKNALLLLSLSYIGSKISGDGTSFVLSLFLCVGFIIPSRQEVKTIKNRLHNLLYKKRKYTYKPAIF